MLQKSIACVDQFDKPFKLEFLTEILKLFIHSINLNYSIEACIEWRIWNAFRAIVDTKMDNKNTFFSRIKPGAVE